MGRSQGGKAFEFKASRAIHLPLAQNLLQLPHRFADYGSRKAELQEKLALYLSSSGKYKEAQVMAQQALDLRKQEPNFGKKKNHFELVTVHGHDAS